MLLVLIAAVFCGSFLGSRFLAPGEAQGRSGVPTKDDIVVVPVQLERERFGLAMVDVTTQTIWVYEFNARGPAHSRLSLWAARSWQYDRLLQQYNTAEPKPEQVKILLESLYQRQTQPDKNEP